MVTRETEYKENKQFSKSIGAGVKSVFGGSGRTYFILEHKLSSEKYRAGQTQEIIIDYIELGRDPKCQVYYGNTFPTVSRRHAAITREGNSWVLKQLSTSNPTLINGRPIKSQWFLQNGDEIQLSLEGPKLGFLIPSNPSIKSIGLSRRLSLFRQQALKPYKKAITALSIFFIVGISVLTYFLWQSQGEIKDLMAKNKELFERSTVFQGNVDSLQTRVLQSEEARKRLESQFAQISRISNKNNDRYTTDSIKRPTIDNDMSTLFPAVYFIHVDKITVELNGETAIINDYKWSGTGFLLDNSRFVTARHVVESWYFINKDDENGVLLNMYANNGAKVTAFFTAISPDGSKLNFNSSSFICDRSTDETKTETDENGNAVIFKLAALNANDWAYVNTSKTGVIHAVNNISPCLRQQQKLHILGYPLGLGASSPSNVSPIYGNCIVSSTQLQAGYIPVTDRNFEHGNSGGPVFYLDDAGKYQAIGIVSAGSGDNTGFIVPITALK
ncbi:MAG: FHA domain-containing protein [Bacteroidales bacterium]